MPKALRADIGKSELRRSLRTKAKDTLEKLTLERAEYFAKRYKTKTTFKRTIRQANQATCTQAHRTRQIGIKTSSANHHVISGQ